MEKIQNRCCQYRTTFADCPVCSIPKAEPFKAWLASVGRERIEETIDPEQAIDRALETYLKKGIPKNGYTNAFWQSASVMS